MRAHRSTKSLALVTAALFALGATKCASNAGNQPNQTNDGAPPSPEGGSSNIGMDGGTSEGGAPPASLGEPTVHRASAEACTLPRSQRTVPEAGPYKSPFGACTLDSECTTGMNGRCENVYNSAACACDYDTCGDDSACNGAVCVCRTTNYNPFAPNHCAHVGNCTTDADCGSGGFCSPSPIAGDLCDHDNIAYYCHTPDDECVEDSQCNPGAPKPPMGPCFYQPAKGHWACYDGPGFGCDGGVFPACGGR